MKYEPFFQVSTSRISYIPTVFEAKFQKIVDCIPFHCMQIKTFQKFHWMINQIRHRKRRQKIVIPQQSYIPVLEWFIMILLLLENSDHIIWFYFPSCGGECSALCCPGTTTLSIVKVTFYSPDQKWLKFIHRLKEKYFSNKQQWNSELKTKFISKCTAKTLGWKENTTILKMKCKHWRYWFGKI